MIRSSCHDVEEVLGSDPETLSEAVRLRLEQHLQECAECRQELTLSRAALATFEQAPLVLSDSTRERALSRALSRVAAGKVSAPKAPASKLLYGAGLTSAAAAAALALWFSHSESTSVPKPADVASVASAAREPAEETVHEEPAAAEARRRASEQGSDGWLETLTAGQTLQFAHARVDVAPNSRVKFDEANTVLMLERGRVDLDVDPAAGKSFSVHTSTFRVQVLGTQFSVTPEEVSVREGHVQVSDHQGKVLARDLAAGTRFSIVGSHVEPRASTDSRVEPRASAAPEPSSVLREARKALAKGQTKAASTLLDSLKRARLERSQQAEESTLRAEIALLERNLAGALEQYEQLARRFRDLSAGENAAFAAAQLAPRVAPTREKSLLESYLARYPKGRFAVDAAARLRELPAR